MIHSAWQVHPDKEHDQPPERIAQPADAEHPHVARHQAAGHRDRQLEHQRQIGTQEINALAVSPDMDTVAVPLRHRAGRRDRGMRDIGAGVWPPDGFSPGPW